MASTPIATLASAGASRGGTGMAEMDPTYSYRTDKYQLASTNTVARVLIR